MSFLATAMSYYHIFRRLSTTFFKFFSNFLFVVFFRFYSPDSSIRLPYLSHLVNNFFQVFSTKFSTTSRPDFRQLSSFRLSAVHDHPVSFSTKLPFLATKSILPSLLIIVNIIFDFYIFRTIQTILSSTVVYL